MGTQLAFGSGDPITYLIALVLGIAQLCFVAFMAYLFCVNYWRQIVVTGCALLALQGVLMYVNSPEAKYQRCVDRSKTISHLWNCTVEFEVSKVKT